MDKLALFSNEKRKNFYFNNINLLFGYSGSGKTTVLEDLNLIFSGKRQNYLINGIPIRTNDFNILKISSFEDLGSHLKLNSKSLLKHYLAETNFPEEFKKDSDEAFSLLENLTSVLSQQLNSILPNSELFLSYNNLLDLILDTTTITTQEDSHSFYKECLFNLIEGVVRQSHKKTIILIDDFDSSLDEETLLHIFESMRKTDAYFFLTTSKTTAQNLLINDTSIYAIRNGHLIQIPDIRKLIMESMNPSSSFSSFEEYMISKGFIENSGMIDNYLLNTSGDLCFNLMRLLTARNPVITFEKSLDKICIIPKSDIEQKIYKTILDTLNETNPINT